MSEENDKEIDVSAGDLLSNYKRVRVTLEDIQHLKREIQELKRKDKAKGKLIVHLGQRLDKAGTEFKKLKAMLPKATEGS